MSSNMVIDTVDEWVPVIEGTLSGYYSCSISYDVNTAPSYDGNEVHKLYLELVEFNLAINEVIYINVSKPCYFVVT